MGKIPFFTKEQRLIFDQVKNEPLLRDKFYFTGGTALSSVYFRHRYSEDMDFFSENKFDYEEILSIVNLWTSKLNFTFKSQFKEVVSIFYLTFKNKQELKVDFGYYPYERVEKVNTIDGVSIDSMMDIAVNKLMTIHQRSSEKDFVDLYFLLKHYTIWDLMEGVRIKFRREIEPWILGADFLYAADQFKSLPKMIKPLTLGELKRFYRNLGMNLAKKAVE